MNSASPLLVTLTLDEESFTFFNALRKQYFPPALNFLNAHLTLFHHLPYGEISIKQHLQEWSMVQPPLELLVAEIKSIGKGVAYKIDCPALQSMHRTMQNKWQRWLSPQDSQKIWPHVTIQNKVSPLVTKQTLKELQPAFTPFAATGTGFTLWSYEGGPWEFVEEFLFAG